MNEIEILKQEIKSQSLQIEKDGNDPKKLCVHLQRINSHLRMNTHIINDLQNEVQSSRSEMSILKKETSGIRQLKSMLEKLSTAILGDQDLQQEGMLKTVKRHEQIINEQVVKSSVFKIWVLPVVIGVATATVSALIIKFAT